MEYTRLVDGEVIGSWSAGQDDFAHPSKLKFQKDGTGFVYQIYTDMKGMEDVWQTIGCFSWNHSGDKIVMTDFVMFFSPLESDVMLEPKQFPSEMEWAITTFSLGNLVVAYTLSNENDRKQVFEEHFVRTMKKVK
jgi:hypothetical protein